MGKKSFVIYTNWAEIIRRLPVVEAGELIQAICNYKAGTEYELENPLLLALFDGQIKPQLDTDDEKYQKKCDRIAAINKSRNEVVSKSCRNRNDIVGDTDTVTDTDKEYLSNTNVLDCSPEPNEFVVKWNELQSIGITPIKRITDKRRKYLNARLRQYGEDSFDECIDAIRESDFLQGKHKGKPWVITFDWLILPNNYIKVLEGNYKNTKTVSGSDFLLNIINGGEG